MSTSMSVLFYARESMANNQGNIRFTCGSQLLVGEIGTKRLILPENWSAETGRVRRASSNARSVNTSLESLLSKAYAHQRQILNEGKEFTMTEFRSRWSGVPLERPRMLMEVFEEHNQQMKALIGHEFSHHTFEQYTTSKKHTQEFIKWKYNVDDIDIRKLNYEFITNYEFWLKSLRKCDHNTAIKYLSNFNKIVNICIKNGWLDCKPFAGFKMTKRQVERPFLVEEKLNRIITQTFLMSRLNQVRDIFIFCCYTGLAYVDVEKLTREEITTGIEWREMDPEQSAENGN